MFKYMYLIKIINLIKISQNLTHMYTSCRLKTRFGDKHKLNYYI